MSNHPTLEIFYRQLVERLRAADIDSAGLEASLLMEHVTGYSRSEQIINAGSVVSDEQVADMDDLMQRRLRGEPLDNIIGNREFYGLTFRVTPEVLSPRPETELLVDYVLSQTTSEQSYRVLDLGTGSGAIIISILKSREKFQAVAIDLSEAALDVASGNAAFHDVSQRIEFMLGSWFEPVTGQFDFIISNPPYITNEAMDKLSVEVSVYDPHLALWGGADGLVAYNVIAKSAAQYLKLGGKLCLEIGCDQGQSVPDVLRLAGFDVLKVQKDLSGHDRCVIACAATNAPIS